MSDTAGPIRPHPDYLRALPTLDTISLESDRVSDDLRAYAARTSRPNTCRTTGRGKPARPTAQRTLASCRRLTTSTPSARSWTVW
jgi:hypothetical protein